jgi:hypothetical protein
VQRVEESFRDFKATLHCSSIATSRSTLSSHLFPNAHDFEIYGGQFTIINTTIDDEARKKSNEIHQNIRQIKVMVIILFGSAGHTSL